jgi:hypothetical protein
MLHRARCLTFGGEHVLKDLRFEKEGGMKQCYSTRGQTVRFAYVASSRVEGKQTHTLCKPKTLPI